MELWALMALGRLIFFINWPAFDIISADKYRFSTDHIVLLENKLISSKLIWAAIFAVNLHHGKRSDCTNCWDWGHVKGQVKMAVRYGRVFRIDKAVIAPENFNWLVVGILCWSTCSILIKETNYEFCCLKHNGKHKWLILLTCSLCYKKV